MLAFPPDYTFLIQVASFFLLVAILNRLLFRPFAELLGERDARTTGDAEQARLNAAAATELRERVEQELAAARAEAMAEVEKLRRATKEDETRLFDEAKARAGSELSKLRDGIERAREEARTSLREEARVLAGDMVETVLGREMSP